MEKIRRPVIFLILFLFSAFVLNSCDTSNTPGPEKPANQYLIESETVGTITVDQAIANFTQLSPESAFGISLFVKSHVDVRKVIYKTTFKEQKIQASGLVCIPKLAGNYPVLSFQNGTNTLHSLAPSEAADDELYKLMENIASFGFIVVVPDYIGFGASSQLPHPYLEAKSTKQSILDLIRAAKEMTSDDQVSAKATNELYLFGYSQGGWATMELQKEIEMNYSDEFTLVASSCGAGPYSIEYMTSRILSETDYPTPYFLAYLLNSYHAVAEINNPLSDFFNEPYATAIPGLFDGNHTGGEINAALSTHMSTLLTEDFRTNYETAPKYLGLRTALHANSIAAWKTTTPTKLYHGTNDEVIPFSMSQKMLADFQTAGVPSSQIELIAIQDADHTSGIYQVGLNTILWFLSLKK